MSKILIQLPFQGFYETKWDMLLGHSIEDFFEELEQLTNNPYDLPSTKAAVLSNLGWDELDITYDHQGLAKAYTEAYAEHHGLRTLEFESLHSPREYNFSTDRIFAYICLAELEKFISDHSTPEEIQERIDRKFRSYDGFSLDPMYEDFPKTWKTKPLDTLDHNEIYPMLPPHTDEEDWELYHDITDYSWDDWTDYSLKLDCIHSYKGFTLEFLQKQLELPANALLIEELTDVLTNPTAESLLNPDIVFIGETYHD